MMFPDANDDRQKAALRLAAQRAALESNGGGETARRIEPPLVFSGPTPIMGRSLRPQAGSWSSQQR
jgi:hypothetical protein